MADDSLGMHVHMYPVAPERRFALESTEPRQTWPAASAGRTEYMTRRRKRCKRAAPTDALDTLDAVLAVQASNTGLMSGQLL